LIRNRYVAAVARLGLFVFGLRFVRPVGAVLVRAVAKAGAMRR